MASLLVALEAQVQEWERWRQHCMLYNRGREGQSGLGSGVGKSEIEDKPAVRDN